MEKEKATTRETALSDRSKEGKGIIEEAKNLLRTDLEKLRAETGTDTLAFQQAEQAVVEVLQATQKENEELQKARTNVFKGKVSRPGFSAQASKGIIDNLLQEVEKSEVVLVALKNIKEKFVKEGDLTGAAAIATKIKEQESQLSGNQKTLDIQIQQLQHRLGILF